MNDSDYKKIYKLILKQLKSGLDAAVDDKDGNAEARKQMNAETKEYLMSSKENEKKLVDRIMGGYENQIRSVNAPVNLENMKKMLREDITVIAARNLVMTLKMEELISKLNATVEQQKTTE